MAQFSCGYCRSLLGTSAFVNAAATGDRGPGAEDCGQVSAASPYSPETYTDAKLLTPPNKQCITLQRLFLTAHD